jgi:hypothetical protein
MVRKVTSGQQNSCKNYDKSFAHGELSIDQGMSILYINSAGDKKIGHHK